jgi:hypothetical protein
MLTGNEFYVVVRLTSGEQLMCALQQEDDNYIELLHPMQIRTIPNFETGKEHVTAAPFCTFTDDESFVLDKKNVLFIKPMKEMFVAHYLNLVRESQNVRFTPKGGEDDAMSSDVEETREENQRVFIEGNETKH